MTENKFVEILLVEDNPHDAKLALHALKKRNLGNRVHVVRDGEEALDFLYGRGQYNGRDVLQKPKVVLLDLKLPKVSGLEVLREMKSNPKLRMMPVVVMTTSSEERDMIESYRLGVNSYIRKPVDFDQFTEVMSYLGYYWLLLNEWPTNLEE